MCRQRGAGGLAVAGQDIDDAGGEAGLQYQLGEAQRAERRLFGRFQHDRAARRQRGRQFPRRHEQREVPGNDLTDDADRLPQGVGQKLAWERERDGRAGNLGGPAAHIAEHVDGERHVRHAGDGNGLAVVDRLDLGEFLAVLFDQFGELPQQFAALGGRHLAPGTFIEGASGRLDGTVDILRVGFGDLRQDGPGRRIIIRECLARGGIDQLAIDQEPIAPAHERLCWCA